ncbi:Photosynthetic NDH subunit of subcomplex B 1 [Carex littledalei]|uniref:Photosynthetic NDH subunit of subcomplex B 1 n=1 Tax=Carex littledalei TaxID=544730 RepID=A0A833QFW1_9POAL|nr:Photosynthetic NDH subunit of subcomplex B 1 [Carex littledalei]
MASLPHLHSLSFHSPSYLHPTKSKSPSYQFLTMPSSPSASPFTVSAKEKNPWLDPFDPGEDPGMEINDPFPEGKQQEDPRLPDNPTNPYGFLKFPQGFNVELADLASKLRGDVRRCCCLMSGGVYENLLYFPVIQLIKNRYPGVEIDIIASARGKQTYEINKNVRWANVYDIDDKFPVPAEYTDMIGVLKNNYYDLVLSTKVAGFAHAAFMFMSSARDKVSYVYPDVNISGLFLTEYFIPPNLNLSESGYHMYDQMIEWLGRPVKNIPKEPVPPLKVSISKKLRAHVAEKYTEAGAQKGKYVVIHGIQSDSVASMQSRGDTDSLLPIELWAEIVKEISDAKPVIVIPHEKEREELEETVGDAAAILFMTTPGKLAALIEDSAGVICTNTAAVQLALARDKPCVALFSSEEKAKLFVPDAEVKNCTVIASKTGKLIDIDVEAAKAAVKCLGKTPVFA